MNRLKIEVIRTKGRIGTWSFTLVKTREIMFCGYLDNEKLYYDVRSLVKLKLSDLFRVDSGFYPWMCRTIPWLGTSHSRPHRTALMTPHECSHFWFSSILLVCFYWICCRISYLLHHLVWLECILDDQVHSSCRSEWCMDWTSSKRDEGQPKICFCYTFSLLILDCNTFY